MGKDQDFVDRLTEASVEAKETLHALYAAQKDALKLIKLLGDALEKMVDKQVEPVIAKRVDFQMEKFTKELKETQEKAANKVTKQFEDMFTRFSNLLFSGEQQEMAKVIEYEREEIKRLAKEQAKEQFDGNA